jgi:hypothetical protein
MQYDKQLIHCDADDRVLEIESLIVDDGLVVSMKTSRSGNFQPFAELRLELEKEGWAIELAGVIHLGKAHQPANSYAATRPIPE